jgi:hypothetical protein
MLASCPTRRPFTTARATTAHSRYSVRSKSRLVVMAGVALQGKQVVVTGASQVGCCPMHHLTYMLLSTTLRKRVTVCGIYKSFGHLVDGDTQQ